MVIGCGVVIFEKKLSKVHTLGLKHICSECGSGIATCPKVTNAYLVDLRRVCEEAKFFICRVRV